MNIEDLDDCSRQPACDYCVDRPGVLRCDFCKLEPRVDEASEALSDLNVAGRLLDKKQMQKRDIEALAKAIRAQVEKFSDRRLNDGDDVWRERELEYRLGIAQTANAICVALDLDVATFSAACGLYVSDGRDSYSDCHPGELTWEKPRD